MRGGVENVGWKMGRSEELTNTTRPETDEISAYDLDGQKTVRERAKGMEDLLHLLRSRGRNKRAADVCRETSIAGYR